MIYSDNPTSEGQFSWKSDAAECTAGTRSSLYWLVAILIERKSTQDRVSSWTYFYVVMILWRYEDRVLDSLLVEKLRKRGSQ